MLWQAAALAGGIGCVRPTGVAVLVGMGAAEVTLPLDLLQRRELIITGTFRYAHAFPEAIALAAEGRVDVHSLISRHTRSSTPRMPCARVVTIRR